MSNTSLKILTYSDFKNRYEVNFKAKTRAEGLLGVGGFGKVFLGYDKLQNLQVAIKRAETDKELLKEVEMGREIPVNTNIARYLDGFRVDTDSEDFDVAVMQYYRAGNLDELFFKREDGARIKATQLDRILKGVLEGLAFLHEGHQKGEQIQYYIHRDLKPANILIAEYQGRFTPLITDFGISKALNRNNREEQHSQGISTTVGTINYKAPEQFTAGAKYNVSLDLWAFGVMLFKILTGRLPFYHTGQHEADYSRREVEDQILNKDLEGIFAQVADQPEKYRELLRMCLVRDYKKRVQSARELIQVLHTTPAIDPVPDEREEVHLSGPTDKVIKKGAPVKAEIPAPSPVEVSDSVQFFSLKFWLPLVLSSLGMAVTYMIYNKIHAKLTADLSQPVEIALSILSGAIYIGWVYYLLSFYKAKGFAFKKKRYILGIITAQLAIALLFLALFYYEEAAKLFTGGFAEGIGTAIGILFVVVCTGIYLFVPALLIFKVTRQMLSRWGLAIWIIITGSWFSYQGVSNFNMSEKKREKVEASKKFQEGLNSLNNTSIDRDYINQTYFRPAVSLNPDLGDSVRVIFENKALEMQEDPKLYKRYMDLANQYNSSAPDSTAATFPDSTAAVF